MYSKDPGGGTTSTKEATPNLLHFLLENLARAEKRKHSNRESVEYSVAIVFLALFLGKNWYEDKLKPRSDCPDEWMLNGTDAWFNSTRPSAQNRTKWWQGPSGLWFRTVNNTDVRPIMHLTE